MILATEATRPIDDQMENVVVVVVCRSISKLKRRSSFSLCSRIDRSHAFIREKSSRRGNAINSRSLANWVLLQDLMVVVYHRNVIMDYHKKDLIENLNKYE